MYTASGTNAREGERREERGSEKEEEREEGGRERCMRCSVDDLSYNTYI